MYKINKDKNNIEAVEEVTFKFAGLKERQHLQEWIAKNPESLGEELLIIQKEFAGFEDTKERLDLLALDKKGNLVVIENKLDDTGTDVVWQTLKYASYCSSLNTQGIKDIFVEYLRKIGSNEDAQKILEDFFDNEDFEEKLNIGNTQRIIMVAGHFRKEVTSTVMWLLNYGLKIQCFRITPYKTGEDYFLDFDQIIPIKEAEEYIIKVASKKREEIDNQEELENRYSHRYRFWSQFLKEINKVNNICANISAPSKENWIGLGIGTSGTQINLVATRDYARVEVYINTGDKDENKRRFDKFFERKNEIEKSFGGEFEWERMDDKVTSRIKYQLNDVSVFKESDYQKMNEFLIDGLTRMRKVFVEEVKNL